MALDSDFEGILRSVGAKLGISEILVLLLPEKTLLAILIEGRMDSENTFFW